MSPRALISALVGAAVLSGCGLRDPYARTADLGARASIAAPSPAQSGSAVGASSAATVLARFGTAWVNWSSSTLAHERETLSALATGALAAQLRRDAARAARSRLQEVSLAFSRGRYVGVLPQPAGRAIVLTYEEAAPAGGTPQGAYHVYLARAELTATGWRVAEWQPATDS